MPPLNTPRLVFIRITLVLAGLLAASLNVFAEPNRPSNVSAFVYSKSAVELFWTPAPGTQVEITRNGQSIGTTDARSLFQSGLSNTQNYTYSLRGVDNTGARSQPQVLELNTADFASPMQRIFANDSGQATQTVSTVVASESVATVPLNLSALIYSSSAVELFWTLAPSMQVEITRNGQRIGTTNAQSLFQSGLSNTQTYTYSLQSVDNTGARSQPQVLELNTAGFVPPIQRIFANDSSQSTQTASTAVAPEPVVPEPLAPEPVNTSTAPINQVVASVPTSIAQGGNNCIANDTSGLISCVNNANRYQRIDIAQDIRCDNNCCPSNQALFNLNGVNGLEIHGHGHRLLRTQNQRQCSLLDIANSSNISVRELSLNDDISSNGCQVGDGCSRMVHVRNANNISFNQTHISHSKGYAFYVQNTNGLTFENGSVFNSGVLGMYIGHGNTPSRNIRITGSTFIDNQTNGLALLGLTGNNVTDNLVADNVFVRNHRLGRFAVAPRFGTGFTGGGQLYVAEANNVTIRNNVVKDGYCENCYVQRVARSGVSGIELGIPNQTSVRNAVISGNHVSNSDGFGISQNSNSNVNNVVIRDNRLLNNTAGLHVNGTQNSGNREIDTQIFESFESSNSIGSNFKGSVQCSSAGFVQRQCGVGSTFGQCAAVLRTSGSDCSEIKAELVSPTISVQGGQSIVADGWVSNPIGNWCVRFRDSSNNQISEQCERISGVASSAVQRFVGLPQLDLTAPGGAHTAEVRVYHNQNGASMLIDDVKISVGQ